MTRLFSKNSSLSIVFAIAGLFSVVVPNTLVLPLVSYADGDQVAEVSNLDSVIAEPVAPAPNDDGTTIDKTPIPAADAGPVEDDIKPADGNRGGGGGGRILQPETPSLPGTITVCKMIIRPNGQVADGSRGLPPGMFSVRLSYASTTGGSPISPDTITFNTTTFSPNTRIISETTNDAECITVSNLRFDLYNWTEESISNTEPSIWQTPLYNDQYTVTVRSLSDLFPFGAIDNADGIIGLTMARPNRTLVILNRYASAPPVITLVGDNPMTMLAGQNFSDPGATAFDSEDGDITSRIVVTGSVNDNIVGSNLRTYSVTDSSGLTDTKTRAVRVEANNESPRGGHGGGGRRAPAGVVLGASIEPPKACSFLVDYLRRDGRNNPLEVMKLQYFLKYFENFSNLELNGVFDEKTFAAVSQFQKRYASDILEPWGYEKPTGFVYTLTQKKINEIFCHSALALTPVQEQEIKNFKALKGAGGGSKLTTVPKTNTQTVTATQPKDASQMPVQSDQSATGGTIKDISDIVGTIYATTTPIVNLVGSEEKDNTGGLRAFAAAIFSVPNSRGTLLQSFYFLLIAVIAVYLAIEIVVGGLDNEKLSKYQIWSRKAVGYVVGLIIAIIIAILYKIFSIVVPLLILLIVSGTFLVWTTTKRASGQVIPLPPKSR